MFSSSKVKISFNAFFFSFLIWFTNEIYLVHFLVLEFGEDVNSDVIFHYESTLIYNSVTKTLQNAYLPQKFGTAYPFERIDEFSSLLQIFGFVVVSSYDQ